MAGKANITKKDIVEDIALRTGLTQVQTKTIVESFLDTLVNGLLQGNNVEIRGFGRFKLKERKERTARNPRTGESVTINAGTKPVFEASKDLIKSLNDVLEAAEKAAAPVKNDA
ncbi:MAG: HU family DNA-binding protein [Fibrobacter sp.]|uniref:HU family DNA-binding protein n=1 Tax=Fibrobacter sp. UWP2 TaxID=1896216 RepID=UPI00090F82D6|nr:HU family DNA-binding protein [Fibrobacter sp. UWP2]MBO7383739.1 HU family DNA-binding protein [Fibrobacter sp.]MCR5378227.1 HU family DNA-binding protein [Fibrobacter sp.]SHI30557.1 DNA-binding protein HU-beta/integration host factor subunit beta [Fibrobacter sp. UWP2]